MIAVGCGGGDKNRSAQKEKSRTENGRGSLLILSISSCRPDRLGCYGNESIETPNIDRLAREGTRFDRAAAATPLTLPSHTTLFTSLDPYRHRVRNNDSYYLEEEQVTAAEHLKEEGYNTAAFVSSFRLDSRFGLDQGFDRYVDDLPYNSGRGRDCTQVPADETVDRAVAWLENEGLESRFFLFVHLFDPHFPYEPPEPFSSMYETSPYDGEIAFLDGEVGRLLDALDRLGLDTNTVVILTSDHGESLGEHGEETHSIFVYESTIRIPLVIRVPKGAVFSRLGLDESVVIKDLVRQTDILPTALDLLALPPMQETDGQSLLPLMLGPSLSPGLIHYAESLAPREDYGWSEVRSICDGRWKFILLPDEELYDLENDPGEERNRIRDEVAVVARLKSLLEKRIEKDRPFDLSVVRDLPDPKERIAGLRRFFVARDILRNGFPVEARERLAALEKDLPDNPGVKRTLAAACICMRDYEGAESALRATIALQPDNLPLQLERANCLIQLDRVEEAMEICRSLSASAPQVPELHVRLGDCRVARGELDLAEEEYRKELERRPWSERAYNGLGTVCRLMRNLEDAIKYWMKALECRSDYAEAHYNLGLLYDERNETGNALRYYKGAIEIDPGLVHAYYNVGLAAKRAGEREQAALFFQESLKRNPRFAKSYFAIGNLLRESGKAEEAIRQYRVALQLDPHDPDVYLNLGVVYIGMGRMDEAVNAWENAIRVGPESPGARTARRNLEQARTQMGG